MARMVLPHPCEMKLTSALIACVRPSVGFSRCFRVLDQDIDAPARAEAFAAAADHPGATSQCPAGKRHLSGPRTLLPERIATPVNGQSSFLFEFGVTKSISCGFHFIVGYLYRHPSLPNDHFSPSIPDSNRDVASIGSSQLSDPVSRALARQDACGPTRAVSTGACANGTSAFESNAITLSLGNYF